ncbi:DUF4350 domain-containing protein [Amnibacterium endophyticum]|uniref:DUF4350 domain-containing protein n=1 Tax=Amnibacterium endophyticum TaxID=2109337 RepID=A0ABW4L9G1_9MICO
MTATAAPANTPTLGRTLRRARFWLIAAAVVLAIVVVQLVATAASRVGGTFDPTSTAPAGARALAQVLRQEGVTVRTTTALDAARRTGGALLVDDSAGLLPSSAWDGLLAAHDRVIVVAPSTGTLRRLAPDIRAAGAPRGRTVAADCDLGLARRAGGLSLEGVTRSLRGSGATVCFRDRGGAGQLVTLRTGGARVLLLADAQAYTNEHIAVAGNAAVALGALGATERLVWYAPDPLELLGPSDRTLQDLTPAWVTPVAALLLLAGLGAALWRGRRLGPVVIERLPVAVRSRETVEGRARLYERGRAHLRAADALRIGAIGRMAPVLGLGRSASVDEVAAAASRATGLHLDRVRQLLLVEEPRGDRDLVRISDDLADLEAAVRAAVLPGGAPTKGTR